MTSKTQDIQDRILFETLKDVPFDGWSWSVVESAAEKAGFQKEMAGAVFPDRLSGVLRHFSDWADREMLKALEDVNIEELRVRDRIRKAVLARIEILEPYKESVKAAAGYWFRPFRKIDAGRVIWQTADKIWIWAGDEAKDYNHYTKRALLAGVMSSTMLAWFNDHTDNSQQTMDFLDRRIDNVMGLGKIIGSLKSKRKFG
jgi:ubiquinone biosynthesis protein COQ9